MTASDFRRKFEVPFSNFLSPVDFIDGVGFSVLEDNDYPDGYVSMYKVGLSSSGSIQSDEIKKVWLSASYGKKVEDGVSLGTTDDINVPVDIDIHQDFSYNEREDKFYYQDKEIIPKDILIKLRNAHRLPTKPIRGFIVREKLRFWRKTLPATVKDIDRILILLLLIISGYRTKKEDIATRNFSLVNKFNSKQVEKENEQLFKFAFNEPDEISFFGYKAKRWSVVFYCIVILLIYILLLILNIHHGYLSKIGKSNFLSLCFVVATFAITESWVPNLLKYLIEKSPSVYRKIVFKRLNVKI